MLNKKSSSIILILYCALFFNFSCYAQDNTKKSDAITINFGIVPQQAASKLAKLWGPILSYLQRETGYKFRFRTAKNIPEFEKRLAKGEYDIAYMNPYHYTVFHAEPGYQAIAKQKNKRIKGILITKKDAPYKTVEELKGNTLAFPAPAAFAASVLPRAYLKNNNIDTQSAYVSSHDSVYRGVAKGLYPAGGGILRTFNNVEPKIRNQLRILWTTKPYTPHAIATHPDMPNDVKTRIQQALISMQSNKEGKALLSKIKFKGIETAHDKDWDDVRGLGIDILNQLVNG